MGPTSGQATCRDQKTLVSRGAAALKRLGNGILDRAIPGFLRPFTNRLKHKYLLRKWSHHADARSFNWNWRKAHFNRIAAVNLLLKKFENPAYLEIGCASNALFDSVPVLKKTGVDPFSGGNVRKTSDAFFEGNEARFDVIFIDGLHTYEQVRRDVLNSIKSLNEGGWIALHDMLPRTWIEQHVPIVSTGAWTGNVWKVAFELIETEGIEFKILKIDHGVGVIKVVDPKAVLKDLRKVLSQKEFSYYFENIHKLPITEWRDAQAWLRS